MKEEKKTVLRYRKRIQRLIHDYESQVDLQLSWLIFATLIFSTLYKLINETKPTMMLNISITLFSLSLICYISHFIFIKIRLRRDIQKIDYHVRKNGYSFDLGSIITSTIKVIDMCNNIIPMIYLIGLIFLTIYIIL